MTFIIAIGGIFVSAFIIGLSGAMMPGPLLAVTIAESTRNGAWTGPRLMVGHMLLEILLVAGVVLGLAPLLASMAFKTTVSLLGGSVMAWMGVEMLRSARKLTLAPAEKTGRGMHPVLAGALVSMSNPYWTIWWATIGLSYILTGMKFGTAGIVAFFVGHILSDFAWYSLVSVSASKGRSVLSNRTYRTIIRLCACLLLAFAAFFVGSGAGRLM